jgi:hypothetical protein
LDIRHAVGVKQQAGAGFELEALGFVGDVVVDGDDELRVDRERREVVAAADERRGVAGGRKLDDISFVSISMTSSVTNWPLKTCVQSWRLTSRRHWPGSKTREMIVRTSSLRRRHQNAAGRPWPVTSPMTIHARPSPISNQL